MSQWEALSILQRAHDGGLEKLRTLETVADELRRGGGADAMPRLREILRFFNGELRSHFLHEEAGLFLVLARVIGRMGPIAAMIEEHLSLWRAVDTLEEHVLELERGSLTDLGEVEKVARHILHFLRSHIQKEDSMLFPLAERSLSDELKQEVVHRMKATVVSA